MSPERTPLRLVLDTNIVLDCFVFTDSRVTPIVNLLHTGAAIALIRDDCLEELRRVLDYPQFKLSASGQAAVFARYRAFVEHVVAPDSAALTAARLPRCQDPDDQKFLELARDGAAAYLVSKDKRVLQLARRRVWPTPFRIVDAPGFSRALATAAIA